jgi:hypothetical protein
MKIKERYTINKSSIKGDTCICPSCQSMFVKEHYQQVFCKTKGGTKCKDMYWNLVTPEKRNNTTRISPASSRWISSNKNRLWDMDEYYEHPFSSEGLGQWED